MERLAELIGGLSLATDLAAGVALETALRTCVVAVRLGDVLGVRGAELSDVYWVGVLRFIGCTAYAHEMARDHAAGDELGLLGALAVIDTRDVVGALKTAARAINPAAPRRQRWAALARMATDPGGPERLFTSHCDLAVMLAERLGMGERVIESLGQIYERFDGRGVPNKLRGERITLPARILHVAWRAAVHQTIGGREGALEMVEQRSGGELDPHLARVFAARVGELTDGLDAPSVWDAFLAAEPLPHVRVGPERVEAIAEAFARFVDVKSPFLLGHSTGVAELVAAAGGDRVAALLHDLGRVSVPNGIWDKPGALNAAEWERVRLHAYYTERILGQTALLRPYAAVAGRHHERLDGQGYHRGVDGTSLDRGARLLAAADVYHAMTEARPHRAARSPEEAARLLGDEARAGKLCQDAVAAVLAAAGHKKARVARDWPNGLSEREVEILCLLARGLTNKEIGKQLFISPKTVKRHLENIFDKTKVRTRAAAAVFAVDQELLKR